METTRVMGSLDIEYPADMDLPARVARTTQEAVAAAQGIGADEVVCGEMGDLMWIPHGARAPAVEQLVAGERRPSEAQLGRAEAGAGAERARPDSEAARLLAERRAGDAALEVRNRRGRVQAAGGYQGPRLRQSANRQVQQG